MTDFPKGSVVWYGAGPNDQRLWIVSDAAQDYRRTLRRFGFDGEVFTMTDYLRAASDDEAAEYLRELLPADLHQALLRFHHAMMAKALLAEMKYRHRSAWASPDWYHLLTGHLLEHVVKGDPRDVAIYCAFAWHHGWPLTPNASDVGLFVNQAMEAAEARGSARG